MKIEEYKDKIVDLCKENSVELVYLFGSFAQDTAGPLSDIDFAILLSTKNKQDYQELRLFFINALMRILHRNDLDVVLLNEAPAALRFNIIKNGRLLYVDDERERIDFESRTIIDYIDTNPLRQEYNEYLFKNIKEGKA